jgi:hypothetical protein
MDLKVIEFDSKIYELKVSIRDYIAIYQLGLIERLSSFPSTIDYLSLCNILFRRYDLDEDSLFDVMDYLVELDINLFLKELLKDSGLFNESESDESQDEMDQDVIPFEQQLDSMLKDCLSFGMSVETFYSMTFKEIRLFIEGVHQKLEMDRKDRTVFDYLLAQLITAGTSTALGGKPFPEYDKYYAGIVGESTEAEMILEGYAVDMLGNKTPIYKPVVDTENDKARANLLAIAEQQKINRMNKDGVVE